ncbi:DUF6090 family protein [Ekhidna sp.]|uniref:DUF6090 family protein n=1 Tax=Ekhidna sp. TaxID=2608089 RepID=UPI0032ED16CC
MEKNKVTTYLLYAIGEIFLVVIGILIAVSINNWNQRRINMEKEQVFMSRIKEESQWNVEALDAQIEEYQEHSKKLDSIAYLLSEGFPQDEELEIPFAPYFIGGWMLKNSAYTELVSSGAMSIINDVKLREMLDEAASMQIIAAQALEYWRSMSVEDVSVFRPYLIDRETRDSDEFLTLDYHRMREDPEAIASLQFWSNANHKFAIGIDEFKDHYERIRDRIGCLELKTCID